MYISE